MSEYSSEAKWKAREALRAMDAKRGKAPKKQVKEAAQTLEAETAKVDKLAEIQARRAHTAFL